LARWLVRDSKYLTIRELSRRHRLSWHSIMGCCGLGGGRGCPSTREPVAIAGTEGKPESIQAESTEATASAAPN
jgi:hypothetical protein